MDHRRKRLLFRARHMGTAENDLLFGTFAEEYLPVLTSDQLDRFEILLEAADPDLTNWVIGRRAVPPEIDSDVMRLLQHFVKGRR